MFREQTRLLKKLGVITSKGLDSNSLHYQARCQLLNASC